MDIFFKKVHPDAIIPAYAHNYDSGFDLYSIEDVIIRPNEVVGIHTGLAIRLPEPFYIPTSRVEGIPGDPLQITLELQIRPKSGRAINEGLTIVNAPGTIDFVYRGELIVIASVLKDNCLFIRKGEKIAQGVVVPVITAPQIQISESEFLGETERGERGFGSTGLHSPKNYAGKHLFSDNKRESLSTMEHDNKGF